MPYLSEQLKSYGDRALSTLLGVREAQAAPPGKVLNMLKRLEGRTGRSVQADVAADLARPAMNRWARFDYSIAPSGKHFQIWGYTPEGQRSRTPVATIISPYATAEEFEPYVSKYVGALNSGGMSDVPIEKIPLSDIFK